MAPTDRSMPPPPMTKVIPTLTTPMTEASRRIVIMLSTLAKRSPAVMTPTAQTMTSAMTRPRLRPADPASSPPRPEPFGGSAGAVLWWWPPGRGSVAVPEDGRPPSGSGAFVVSSTLTPRLLS